MPPSVTGGRPGWGQVQIGTVLIGLFLVASVLHIVLLAPFRATGGMIWRRSARLAMVVGFLSLTASLLLLINAFLSSDFSIKQVWEHSGRDLPWWLKLSGSWAGRSGSLMLWTWLISLSLFIEEMRGLRRERAARKTVAGEGKSASPATGKRGLGVHDWSLLIATIPAIVFGVILLYDSPFTALHGTPGMPYPLETYPDGVGLNPLLRTVWMVVHPPLLFVGYAFITIPFAAGIAGSLTRDRSWTDVSLHWSRIAWVFLTLGIGVGAAWAYVVLGWGGYWGWDPVEVSSLVPWVTLTAFLHAQIRNRRHGEYGVLAPFMGLATFVLVIFATYVTRGGDWASVHAWEGGDVFTFAYLGLMAGSLVLGGIVLLRNLEWSGDGRRPVRTRDMPMYATVVLLAVTALVLFLGVLVNRGSTAPGYYETRLAPVAILLALALGLCLSVRFVKRMKWYHLSGWLLLAGVIGAVVLPRLLRPGLDTVFYDLGPLSVSRATLAGFVLPALLFALAASMFRTVKHARGGLRNALMGMGPHLAHIGVALVLIGYVATNTFNNETTLTLSKGTAVEYEGYTFELDNVSVRTEGEKEVHDYAVSVGSGGQVVGTAHPLFVVYRDTNRNITQASILTRPTEDVYMYIVPMQEFSTGGEFHALQVRVRTLPLPLLLWLGMVLLAVGMGARFAGPPEAPPAPATGPAAVSVRELDGMALERLRALARDLGIDDRGSAKALRRRLRKRLSERESGSDGIDRD
ncbi:MAG: hypothetical protein FJ149_05220 [Euryarchaeota archaeon]|nr:hypothetical protein [Euryarchaeota archaeon]